MNPTRRRKQVFAFSFLLIVVGLYLASGFANAEKITSEELEVNKLNCKVYINGNEVQSDVGFYEYNNIIYGPLRCIAEAMELQANWDGATRQVTLLSENDTLVIAPNSSKYMFNGVEYDLPGPVTIANGRIVVPIKTIVEAFGGTYGVDKLTDKCFIATAAFGSKFTWPVTLLRDFRDQYMLTNPWGTSFVRFYYNNSPPVAAFIANNKPLKILVRVLLTPIIAVIYLLYHPTTMVIAIGMGMLLLGFCFYRRCYLQI